MPERPSSSCGLPAPCGYGRGRPQWLFSGRFQLPRWSRWYFATLLLSSLSLFVC
ncbi:hypothetical protein [Caudoviricetes sp.]|nr:hypothetical protein [Caudoviricetes sp.]